MDCTGTDNQTVSNRKYTKHKTIAFILIDIRLRPGIATSLLVVVG